MDHLVIEAMLQHFPDKGDESSPIFSGPCDKLNRAYSEGELSVLLPRFYGLPPPWENENHRLKKVPLGGDTVDVSEIPARKPVAIEKYSNIYTQGFFQHLRWLFGISSINSMLVP